MEDALPFASISTVNLSEVVAKLAETGGTREQITSAIDLLRLKVEPFDEELAVEAGLLRPLTRDLGLSLGDRACLAVARRRKATAMTSDRAWRSLSAHLGILIEVIR